MPVFSRKVLRQTLGQSWLRDTVVSRTSASWGYAAFSLNFIDFTSAGLGASGLNLYVGSWLYMSGAEIRVASFNAGSGAYFSQDSGALLGTTIVSGSEYERHDMLPPTDKNRALDDVIPRLRIRQEVGITALSGALFYDLDAAASPHRIADVLDAYVFSSPSDPANRVKRSFSTRPVVVPTATGVELRIDAALDLSSLLVVDALLELTLGLGDNATINIPDDRPLLAGAAAKCWEMMVARSPAQQVSLYQQRQYAAAREFSRLSARDKDVTRRLGFDDPF